jgi:DNA-directed RNA polymerase subunit RPC12/RpoP
VGEDVTIGNIQQYIRKKQIKDYRGKKMKQSKAMLSGFWNMVRFQCLQCGTELEGTIHRQHVSYQCPLCSQKIPAIQIEKAVYKLADILVADEKHNIETNLTNYQWQSQDSNGTTIAFRVLKHNPHRIWVSVNALPPLN